MKSYLFDIFEKISSTKICLSSLFDDCDFFCNLCCMPELPEVETVRTFLKNNIIQEHIISIEIKDPNLRFKISKEIPKYLYNSTITKISRRGKYLIFLYSNNYALVFHLGMTGYFRIENFYKSRKHDHLIINFKEKKLIFNDIRKFGFVKIYDKKKVFFSQHLKILGPDPLCKEFSFEYFSKHLRRNTNIKNLLMNQSFVSGLGNIYCSEILFDSRINQTRIVRGLKNSEVRRILKSTRKILRHAIKLGGTTIKNFVVSDEKIGYFKNMLMVYGREGLPCLKCKKNNIVYKIVQSGRSTFFCSNCQS